MSLRIVRIRSLTPVAFVAVALVAAALLFTGAAESSEPHDPGGVPAPESQNEIEEYTPTSLSFHEFSPPPKSGFRMTMLDGVVTFDGQQLTNGQARALSAAGKGLCRNGTNIPKGLSSRTSKLPDTAAASALSAMDCSVVGFVIEVDEKGRMSGILGTTDASRVAGLQELVGEEVLVQYQRAGMSLGPEG